MKIFGPGRNHCGVTVTAFGPSESEGIRGTELLGSAKYDATDLSGSSITDKHKLEGWHSLSCSCHVGGCIRNCGVM